MASSIRVEGLEKLIKKLGELATVDKLEPPMQRAVLRVHAKMATYPPQRSGSAYVRTGTLGRRWTTKVTKTGRGITGRVGNNTTYAPLVQSKQYQAKVHRRLWRNTDERVIEGERKAILDDFRSAVQDALRR